MNGTSLAALAALMQVGMTGLQGQVPDSIQPGTRIRVRALDRVNAVVGTITARDSSTITLRTLVTSGADSAQHADVVIPQNQITVLEVSRGEQSNAGRGALIGGLAGAGLGLLLGSAYASCGNSEYCPGEVVLPAAAVFGFGGAAVGALIGSGSHHERWERVPLTSTVSLQAIPAPSPGRNDGATIGLSLRL